MEMQYRMPTKKTDDTPRRDHHPSISSVSPALVDIDEMSRRLGGIAKGTLYNWVYLRRIPFRKCGRCLRFDPDEVIQSLTLFAYNGSGEVEVEGVNQMALYRRTEVGPWYADYYADGKRMQESTGTANKREAEKFLALRVSEVHRGVYVKPVHVALSELRERYIAYAKLHKRSWKRDMQLYGNLKTFFGNVNLSAITPMRWRTFSSIASRRLRQRPSTVPRPS
jgi:hypothetical protein